MKRYPAVLLLLLLIAAVPCQAQFLKKLEQDLMGGQAQGQQGAVPAQQAQAMLVGNVNLPPGQYLMTNVQSGQAFYVVVQNGQMLLTGQPVAPQTVAPGQGLMQQQPQGGLGGIIDNGIGNFLKNEVAPQQAPGQ